MNYYLQKKKSQVIAKIHTKYMNDNFPNEIEESISNSLILKDTNIDFNHRYAQLQFLRS